MTLTIVNTRETKSLSVVWLEINTPSGNFVIQPGHAPTLLVLSPNQPLLFKLKSGKQETLVARYGVVEVDRDGAKLVIDEAT